MNPPDCFTTTCIIWHNYHQPIAHSLTQPQMKLITDGRSGKLSAR